MAVKGLNLQFFCPPTYVDFHVLVTTGVDFEQAQIHTQVDASFSAFGHPIQIHTSWTEVICTVRCVELWIFATWEWTCKSVWPTFASPYTSSGFANLCTFESVWPGLKTDQLTVYSLSAKVLNSQPLHRQTVGSLSKRGRRRQCQEARKIFLRNPPILLSISLRYPVSIFTEIQLTPASPPERSD